VRGLVRSDAEISEFAIGARRMVRLRFDHKFKNLRSDPQYIDVLGRVNPAPHATVSYALADLDQRRPAK
jgi:hypothetical protein